MSCDHSVICPRPYKLIHDQVGAQVMKKVNSARIMTTNLCSLSTACTCVDEKRNLIIAYYVHNYPRGPRTAPSISARSDVNEILFLFLITIHIDLPCDMYVRTQKGLNCADYILVVPCLRTC